MCIFVLFCFSVVLRAVSLSSPREPLILLIGNLLIVKVTVGVPWTCHQRFLRRCRRCTCASHCHAVSLCHVLAGTHTTTHTHSPHTHRHPRPGTHTTTATATHNHTHVTHSVCGSFFCSASRNGRMRVASSMWPRSASLACCITRYA